MKRCQDCVIRLAPLVFLNVAIASQSAHADGWDDAQRQPAVWFRTDEGRRVVDNVLLFQLPSGGWPKNIDMAAPLDEAAIALLAQRPDESTIDNGATVSQLRFLSRAIAATSDDRARDAFLKGFDSLLAAQYENGGWPQSYPHPRGYQAHITFNDNAMAGVLELLRDAAAGHAPYEFVDADRRRRAEAAIQKGIDCIIKCQVIVDGRRTAWCAQHDEKTFVPAAARAFEPVSLSGSESVGLVRFLMSVEKPSPDVISAIQAAAAWLDGVQINHSWLVNVQTTEGPDRALFEDPRAGPIWARFYEIGTNRPMFAGRDGIVRYSYAEIERERRLGYAYYGTWPTQLLRREYTEWVTKWGIPPQR